MLYFSRLLNACGYVILAAAIMVQRDADGSLLVHGWHGLGYAVLFAILAACLNFRGALSAALLDEETGK